MTPTDDYNDTFSSSFIASESDYVYLYRGNHGNIAEIFISFVVWSMCCFTILGNALIIATFVLDGKVRRKVSNLYILNLAICDFLIGLNSLLFNNLYRHVGIWIYGEAVCKTWLVLDWTASIVSVWAIVLISYDRYVLVTRGLAYDRIQTRRKFCCLAGSVWVIFGLRIGIVIIGYDFWYETWVDYTTTCDTAADYVFPLVIFNSVTSFCIPVLLTIVFNTVVFVNIRQRTRGLPRNWASSQIYPEETTDESSSVNPTASSNNPVLGTGEQRRHREGTSDVRKLRRSAVTLALIVGISALCWLPYYVYIIAKMLHVTVDTTVVLATYYIWWSNSLWNPVLYVATNPGIRRAVLKILHFHHQ